MVRITLVSQCWFNFFFLFYSLIFDQIDMDIVNSAGFLFTIAPAKNKFDIFIS